MAHTFIRNLSGKHLDEEVTNLLQKGLSYVTGSPSLYDIYTALTISARRCRLRQLYRDSEPELLLHGCQKPISRFNPGVSNNPQVEKYLTTLEVLVLGPLEQRTRDPLQCLGPPSPEVEALSKLRKDSNLIFKVADKGAILCILDRDKYVKDILSPSHLLDTTKYRVLRGAPGTILLRLQALCHTFIHNLVEDYSLPNYMKDTLQVSNARLGLFYGNPKIHKPADPTLECGYPLRGITSCASHPCANLSEFVHRLLKPILHKTFLPELVCDSLGFLQEFEDARHLVSPTANVATADISSMFTEIPQAYGSYSCAWVWHRLKETTFPDHPLTPFAIYVMVNFILTHSFFTFLDATYSILGGTAMGQSHSVVLANVFMSLVVQHFIGTHPHWYPYMPFLSDQPFLKRMLDDLFFFWYGDRASFDSFLAEFNEFTTNVGYKVQLLATGFCKKVQFLDIEVYQDWDSTWQSKIYHKTTDVHAYLAPTSNHPPVCIKNIPYGVALRIKRCCTKQSDFWNAAKLYSGFFRARGYKHKHVKDAFHKASLLRRSRLLTRKDKRSNRFSTQRNTVFTFPWGTDIDIKQILGLCARAFGDNPDPPFHLPQPVSFTVGPPLKSRLIRASACLPTDNLTGCLPCDSPTCILDLCILPSRTIQSSSTGDIFPIRQRITCASHNIIYVITCLKCVTPGVGECLDAQKRLMPYYTAIRDRHAPSSTSCSILKHFLETEHSINDLQIAFVASLPSTMTVSPSTQHTSRIRLEWMWIKRLQATLNTKTNLRHFFSGYSSARHDNNMD